MTTPRITVNEIDTHVSVTDPTRVVVVRQGSSRVTANLSGVPGSPGPPGDDGAPGAPGGTRYSHIQVVASTFWLVAHNLGYFPHVSVLDIDDNDISDGVLVTHIDENNATVNAGIALAGKAECS